MNAITELAVETVRIQKGEKELKISFLAVMGRGGHQQKMPGDAA